MIYQFIEKNKKTFTITKMCKVLGICRKAYHDSGKRVPTKKEINRALVKKEIKNIFFETKQLYGSPRMTKELKERGYKACYRSVVLYMHQLGLCSLMNTRKIIKRKPNLNSYVAPNILNPELKFNEPSRAWISAIKYFKTTTGYLYLTIILDLYDRKIIGWSISNRLKSKKTSIAALRMAAINREITNELIFHSSRGVQYANRRFVKTLESYKKIKPSMSQRKDYNDNAILRNFFLQFKKNVYKKNRFFSEKDLKFEMLECIEEWNNKNESILI